MSTHVVIDEELVADAMRWTGIKSERRVVEEALRTLIRLKRRKEIRQLRGKLHWDGDLDELRHD